MTNKTKGLVPRRFTSIVSHNGEMYAVADDGTAWKYRESQRCRWIEVDPLPKNNEKNYGKKRTQRNSLPEQPFLPLEQENG